MKLVSIKDFVLSIGDIIPYKEGISSKETLIKRLWIIENYADFLNKKLDKFMFFPVDYDNNILQKPEVECLFLGSTLEYDEKEYENYNIQKEKCLFNGCTPFGKNVCYGIYLIDGETIEDLVKFNLQLTETAIKQIGL